MPVPPVLADPLARARELVARANGRVVLGISGAPGSGKSTLARQLAGAIDDAVVVPMDGFHLADVELDRIGLRHRKGAPETFDGWGYAALLRRLREERGHSVLAPAFERDLEQPLAGAIAVEPHVRLVITEGNYLLLDRPEWRAARGNLDEVWHLRVDDALRRERLIARHVRFGKSPDAAAHWVDQVDEPNARLVEETAAMADLLVSG